MNTPDSKLHDDSHTHHSLIVRSESQFNKNRIQRTQARDYGRILRENKVPPLWYRTPGPPCSIYFYDPHYQRHIRERSNDWIPATPIRTKTSTPSLKLPQRLANQRKTSFAVLQKSRLETTIGPRLFAGTTNPPIQSDRSIRSQDKPILPPISSARKSVTQTSMASFDPKQIK